VSLLEDLAFGLEDLEAFEYGLGVGLGVEGLVLLDGSLDGISLGSLDGVSLGSLDGSLDGISLGSLDGV
jgi:hypothetical protein